MSESGSNAFRRITQRSGLIRPALLPATLSAVAASLVLAAGILILGTITAVAQYGTSTQTVSVRGATGSGPASWVHQWAVNLEQNTGLSRAAVWLVLGAAALFALRRLLHTGVRGFVVRHVSSGVQRLREHIHRQALRLDAGDLTGTQMKATQHLFRQTSRQLEEQAGDYLTEWLKAFCDLLVLAIVVLAVHWRAGLECLLPVLLGCWILRLEMNRHRNASGLLSEQVHRGLERLSEGLRKPRLVRGYGMESLEHEQFETGLQQYRSRLDELTRQQLRGEWVSLAIRLVMFSVPGIILLRHAVNGDLLGLPGCVMIAAALPLAARSMEQLAAARAADAAGAVAGDEIGAYLRKVPAVGQRVGAKFLEPMSRALQFDQVSFELEDGSPLLNGIDLTVRSGERVALLSLDQRETRALVSLVPRFNDASRGQVLIDGNDVTTVTLESLRAEAMIVSGHEPLFNATVLQNITCGHADISRQDAIEACKQVHAESLVRSLPDGYETVLGEHGTPLTDGQAFRIALARAAARKPALMIIEEPDSALTAETKALLDDAYQRLLADRTVIFLPTRLSTVKRCARIVMIQGGQVAADGKHEDLVKNSELYRHWEYLHFNAFRSSAAHTTEGR